MKVIDLFDYVNEVKPHQYEEDVLLVWLNDLEKRIFKFYDEFEYDENNVEEYTPHTGLEEELYADDIELYRYWLASKIDFANNEFTYYNNSAVLYNEEWNEFQADYGREHKSKVKRNIKV